MKNQHQTKKLGLKKLNITLLTSHKLSQIRAGEVPSAAVNGCEHSVFADCRSFNKPPCGNQTDINDLVAYR
ncbi:hypothetical protein [Aquimarina macrocephali]|uniref:hypothetical protein n=1 Tax=Aquimarina macrocephali TaxID=666563 RepID=UPI000463870D|nr:hypothetical protein [Aquimarina macrocephali]